MKTLLDKIDENQSKALVAARAFLDGKISDDERLEHLDYHRKHMDRFMHENIHWSRPAIINRLVCGTLITNDGLSHELAEFTIELAEKLNLPDEQIDEIFARHIPEYEKGLTAR